MRVHMIFEYLALLEDRGPGPRREVTIVFVGCKPTTNSLMNI